MSSEKSISVVCENAKEKYDGQKVRFTPEERMFYGSIVGKFRARSHPHTCLNIEIYWKPEEETVFFREIALNQQQVDSIRPTGDQDIPWEVGLALSLRRRDQ